MKTRQKRVLPGARKEGTFLSLISWNNHFRKLVMVNSLLRTELTWDGIESFTRWIWGHLVALQVKWEASFLKWLFQEMRDKKVPSFLAPGRTRFCLVFMCAPYEQGARTLCLPLCLPYCSMPLKEGRVTLPSNQIKLISTWHAIPFCNSVLLLPK